ncbi:MAG: AMP-binding protein [Actinomycetales bacterium]|nr:AMP-binding protein [Actinomycetales bacterium]
MQRPEQFNFTDTGPVPDDHPALAIFGVSDPTPDSTLVDILRTTMDTYPDMIALESPQSSLTYEDLRIALDAEATRLADLGIGRGSRVGIRVPSGTTDLYVAILATLWAGAAYVPVDWDDPDSRARTVWEEAAVDAVYGEDLSLTRMNRRAPGDQGAHLNGAPTPDDDAWIIFTSGSTGTPKGVAITHRSAAALVHAEAKMYLVDDPLGPGDRVMAGLSVAFDASCEEMWLAWRYGATLVAAHRDVVRSGDSLAAWLIGERITAVSTVPTLASFWPVEALDRVRLLIFGGEACPLELVQRLSRPGREIWNTYGPTETTIIATGELMSGQPPVRIGRPVPGWQLVVVDDDGLPVAWGEEGELIVGGIGLGRYLDPAKDAEAYAPLPSLGWDRAYRTGDLVLAEPEGLIFRGRKDDQIKFAGRRLELGELDGHLSRLPGVRVGAAVLHQTTSGSDVLVGYLVPDDGVELDMPAVRAQLATALPGGITPVLGILPDMPVKTSGKVDRKALPWPLPATAGEDKDSTDPLPEDLEWLAERWRDQLGPVPLTPDADFFDLGGSSVAVAKLVTDLRRHHPAAELADLYTHRTLRDMADYLDTLSTDTAERPMPGQIPWYAGPVQALVIAGLYLINGLKYVLGAIAVVWVLDNLFGAAWVPHPPLWPILLGWVLIFSVPGRLLQATVGVRLLTAGVRPGTYRRGGPTHLRVWAADRLLTFLRLDPVLGSPVTPLLFRLLGNRVGARTSLQSFPPVTGLLTVGDDVSVEPEVDLAGHWIDGDRFHVGTIDLSDGVRVGTRSLITPDSTVGTDAEILPGSLVDTSVPARQLWGGSPLRNYGDAGQNWPAVAPGHDTPATGAARPLHRGEFTLLHLLGLAWMSLLPILAITPGILLVMEQVRPIQRFGVVFPVLLAWSPLVVLMTVIFWLGLVIGTVRVLAPLIRPGYYPQTSVTAWAVWLTQALMEKTLTSTYFVYASSFTPAFFRMLGARVGAGTEISTATTIPHLTWIQDHSFVADHALLSAPRYRAGWIHVGSTVVGEGSFVGNSAIVGPDRDLPPDSLVAVLSSTPYHPAAGSTWLGRTPRPIPRQHIDADDATTFRPSRTLRISRAVVESFRLLPAFIAAALDIAIVYLGTRIYMAGLVDGGPWRGLLWAVLAAGPLVLAAGIIASLLPVLVKWLLIGRFRAGDRALFDSFVWRSELADNFAEPLAVPSLIRMSLGTPFFNVWARLMGTRIGRHVWCETWWLPEFDLITIGDHATVNRGTVLQTHLFHDRIMSLEPVTLEPGATLGPNSFLLPGATIGARTTIGPSSLVLRRDEIPADSEWAGNPVSHTPAPAPAVTPAGQLTTQLPIQGSLTQKMV